MQKFLATCTDLDLDKVADRSWMLIASIQGQTSDVVLFFICGYDFIFNPSDQKYAGLWALFLESRSPFEINIYPDCREAMRKELATPISFKRTMGGTTFHPRMRQTAGVRAGGAGNYNLQTKALEMVVTHWKGLSCQSTLTEVIRKSKNAFTQRLTPQTDFQRAQCTETLTEMRTALNRYWGADVRNLGL